MYCKRCNAKLSEMATVCGLCGSTEFTATPSDNPVSQAVPVTQAPAAPSWQPSVPQAAPVAQEPVAPSWQPPVPQAAPVAQKPVAPSWQPPVPQAAPAAYEEGTVYAPASYPTLPKKSKRKLWNWAGILLGIVTILAGVVFLFKEPNYYSTSTPSYASFGADFYTYEYGATRAAAMNTDAAATTLRELEGMVLKLGGLAFMVAGALIVIHFGKKCVSDEKA